MGLPSKKVIAPIKKRSTFRVWLALGGAGLQERARMTDASIKVGMIAEQTGALAFMGGANANVAKMVVGDLGPRSDQ
jgi:hypothetical protein